MSGNIESLLEKAEVQLQSSDGKMSSVSFAERDFPTDSEAHTSFIKFKEKLCRINNWNSYAVLTSFELFGENGELCRRNAGRVGDFVRVSMTGTGKSDWVKITRIDEDAPGEIILTVQPTYNPTGDAPDKAATSHFFSSESSNNFCLRKHGETINFYVVGLDEKSNKEDTTNIIETARNIATANLGHYLGIQKAEWTAFCKNFLEADFPK